MYHDEDGPAPYDGAVEIPEEIQKIRDPLIFNLTRRELCFVSAGLLLAALLLWFLFRVAGVKSSALVLLPGLAAAPFGLFAFVRPMGLNLEDWLTIWVSCHVRSAPVRKLSARNEYEKLLELVQAREGKAGPNWKKRWAGRKKKQKSAYRIRQ